MERFHSRGGHKVCSLLGGETSAVTSRQELYTPNPLHSVKFPNFRSLQRAGRRRGGRGGGSVLWSERNAGVSVRERSKAKGASFQFDWRHPRPYPVPPRAALSSLLSTSILEEFLVSCLVAGISSPFSSPLFSLSNSTPSFLILHHSPCSSVRSPSHSPPPSPPRRLSYTPFRFVRLPPFSPLALYPPFPLSPLRFCVLRFHGGGVLTVYFDLDLREISRNSLGGNLGSSSAAWA